MDTQDRSLHSYDPLLTTSGAGVGQNGTPDAADQKWRIPQRLIVGLVRDDQSALPLLRDLLAARGARVMEIDLLEVWQPNWKGEGLDVLIFFSRGPTNVACMKVAERARTSVCLVAHEPDPSLANLASTRGVCLLPNPSVVGDECLWALALHLVSRGGNAQWARRNQREVRSLIGFEAIDPMLEAARFVNRPAVLVAQRDSIRIELHMDRAFHRGSHLELQVKMRRMLDELGEGELMLIWDTEAQAANRTARLVEASVAGRERRNRPRVFERLQTAPHQNNAARTSYTPMAYAGPPLQTPRPGLAPLDAFAPLDEGPPPTQDPAPTMERPAPERPKILMAAALLFILAVGAGLWALV